MLLLLKHHKTTILLHVNPYQTFTSIKSQLHSALSSARITSINGDTIPPSAENIEFGVPRNLNDLSEGFVKLAVPDADKKGKGKGKARNGEGVLNESPKGAGLRDGQVVAFRFVSKKGDEGERAKEESEETEGDVMEVEVESEEEEWDVVVPVLEYEEG
jgi:hypothetical protein